MGSRNMRIMLTFIMILSANNLLWSLGMNYFQFEPSIVDARAEALGKTSLLSTQEANNVFNNPAALPYQEGSNIIVSLRSFTGQDDITNKVYDDSDGYTAKRKYDYKLATRLSGLSLAWPVDVFDFTGLDFGFGIGYRTYYDNAFKADYRMNSTENDYRAHGDYESHGGYNILTLAGGVAIDDDKSAGISVSMPFKSKSTYESDVVLESFENDYNSLSENDIHTTYKGSFVTLSLMYELSNHLTAAFRWRAGFTLTSEANGKSRYIDSSGNDKSDSIQNEVEYTIPAEYCVALQYESGRNFRLFAEYLTRSLSEYKEFEYSVNNENSAKYYDDEMWPYSDDGYAIHFGMEYGTYNCIRVGYYLQSVPYYDIDDTGNLEETPKHEMGFTGGFSIPLSCRTQLDIYGCYSMLNFDQYYNLHDNSYENDFEDHRITFGISIYHEL